MSRVAEFLSVTPSDIYTSKMVSRLTGLTARQLQWWDEQGVVSPVQVRHKRLYSAAQVEELRKIKVLRKAGVGLRKVRKYLKWEYAAVLKITVPTVINGTLVIPK